jgi:hypothetical protein
VPKPSERSSCQLIEQRLRLFQIERVEPFDEPAVDRSEKFAGLLPLALIAPQSLHAVSSGHELPRPLILGTFQAISSCCRLS